MDKEKLIEQILLKYSFKNIRSTNPDSCPCYNGKKCHTLPDEELICLLCLCPEYQVELRHEDGTCKINSPFGKFSNSEYWGGKGIWDCTDCSIPHTKDYVRKYLERLGEGELKRFLK